MSDEKENIETRTVTLNVTKVRGEVQTESDGGGSCGPWFFEIKGGHTYSCRWCATSGPTAHPYKECIQLPD